MKIELVVPICGPEGSFNAGDAPELSEKLATALIKNGHAKEIQEKININRIDASGTKFKKKG